MKSVVAGSGGINNGRNTVAKMLLASAAEWVFVTDTDHGLAPDDLYRLLDVADPVARPCIGGLYFGAWNGASSDGVGGWRGGMPWPEVWRRQDDGSLRIWWDYPRNALIEVGATGHGFLLIHRSVFERLREREGPGWAGWYDPMPDPANPGRWCGEDIGFCRRLAAAGIPVFVHTGVKATHHKAVWLGEEDYLAARRSPAPACSRSIVSSFQGMASTRETT